MYTCNTHNTGALKTHGRSAEEKLADYVRAYICYYYTGKKCFPKIFILKFKILIFSLQSKLNTDNKIVIPIKVLKSQIK